MVPSFLDLLWLVASCFWSNAFIRLDCVYAVIQLTGAMSKPMTLHIMATKRVLGYIQRTIDFCIMYMYRTGNFEPTGVCDASHETFSDQPRSCAGMFFMLAGGVISAALVPQKTIAQFTTEVDLSAFSSATKGTVHVSRLLKELGFRHFNTIKLQETNKALTLAGNSTYSPRTKHAALQYHARCKWVYQRKPSV